MNNTYDVAGDIVLIHLKGSESHGAVAVVDLTSLSALLASPYTWYARYNETKRMLSAKGSSTVRSQAAPSIGLAAFLLGLTDTWHRTVVHLNGNLLDCRANNIRAKTERDRFMEKIRIEPNGCWHWVGGHNDKSYGVITSRNGKRHRMAHRVVYESLVGPIPPGLALDHLCRNHWCVNPKHLEPVTLGENTLRGDGPSARNARKTHCKVGHLLSASHTENGRLRRRCPICQRTAIRKYMRKRNADGIAGGFNRCSVADCNRVVHAACLCGKHYQQKMFQRPGHAEEYRTRQAQSIEAALVGRSSGDGNPSDRYPQKRQAARTILAYLESHPGYHSPTSIAQVLWPETNRRSRYTSPILLILAGLGAVERDSLGHYRAKEGEHHEG